MRGGGGGGLIEEDKEALTKMYLMKDSMSATKNSPTKNSPMKNSTKNATTNSANFSMIASVVVRLLVQGVQQEIVAGKIDGATTSRLYSCRDARA